MGLRPLLPSVVSVVKLKIGQIKWGVSRFIIKSGDLISFKSILWETATHQCQLCLLLESIIFLKSYLILWKCNLYNIKCKQTFPENHDLQKRDYHFRMEVVLNSLLIALWSRTLFGSSRWCRTTSGISCCSCRWPGLTWCTRRCPEQTWSTRECMRSYYTTIGIDIDFA